MRLIFKAHRSLLQMGVSGIVNTLNTQMNKALKDLQLAATFEAKTFTMMPMTPQQFTAFFDKDVSKWKKLAKDRGIEVGGA